eukprot:5642103-Alexandrium_andersonii.AAC.1
MTAGTSGLTGVASSGPPAGRNPSSKCREHPRTATGAESSKPCACSVPAATPRPRPQKQAWSG